MYKGEIYMKNRKFLVTFGYNLDHSNIDYLVSDRLSRHKGWIQKDYFDPVSHRGRVYSKLPDHRHECRQSLAALLLG